MTQIHPACHRYPITFAVGTISLHLVTAVTDRRDAYTDASLYGEDFRLGGKGSKGKVHDRRRSLSSRADTLP